MRVIKFRAWNIEDSKMSCMLWNYYNYLPYIDKSKYIWMQYTWLKDKNWNEIYEGDVLKSNNGMFREVTYNKWRFLAYTDDLYKYTSMVESVWNIYENQDLIPNKIKWE